METIAPRPPLLERAVTQIRETGSFRDELAAPEVGSMMSSVMRGFTPDRADVKASIQSANVSIAKQEGSVSGRISVTAPIKAAIDISCVLENDPSDVRRVRSKKIKVEEHPDGLKARAGLAKEGIKGKTEAKLRTPNETIAQHFTRELEREGIEFRGIELQFKGDKLFFVLNGAPLPGFAVLAKPEPPASLPSLPLLGPGERVTPGGRIRRFGPPLGSDVAPDEGLGEAAEARDEAPEERRAEGGADDAARWSWVEAAAAAWLAHREREPDLDEEGSPSPAEANDSLPEESAPHSPILRRLRDDEDARLGEIRDELGTAGDAPDDAVLPPDPFAWAPGGGEPIDPWRTVGPDASGDNELNSPYAPVRVRRFRSLDPLDEALGEEDEEPPAVDAGLDDADATPPRDDEQLNWFRRLEDRGRRYFGSGPYRQGTPRIVLEDEHTLLPADATATDDVPEERTSWIRRRIDRVEEYALGAAEGVVDGLLGAVRVFTWTGERIGERRERKKGHHAPRTEHVDFKMIKVPVKNEQGEEIEDEEGNTLTEEVVDMPENRFGVVACTISRLDKNAEAYGSLALVDSSSFAGLGIELALNEKRDEFRATFDGQQIIISDFDASSHEHARQEIIKNKGETASQPGFFMSYRKMNEVKAEKESFEEMGDLSTKYQNYVVVTYRYFAQTIDPKTKAPVNTPVSIRMLMPESKLRAFRETLYRPDAIEEIYSHVIQDLDASTNEDDVIQSDALTVIDTRQIHPNILTSLQKEVDGQKLEELEKHGHIGEHTLRSLIPPARLNSKDEKQQKEELEQFEKEVQIILKEVQTLAVDSWPRILNLLDVLGRISHPVFQNPEEHGSVDRDEIEAMRKSHPGTIDPKTAQQELEDVYADIRHHLAVYNAVFPSSHRGHGGHSGHGH